jgi:lysophospholipase L1-like esterase
MVKMKSASHIVLALVTAILVSQSFLTGQNSGNAQHWIGTWFAPSVARAAQTAPPAATTTASPAPATGQPQEIPAAVRAVTPNQQLAVGGQSPLHFKNQTLRQVARVSVGGSRLRLVFTNSFGTVPLKVGAAHVALRSEGASIVPGSGRPLMFAGRPSASISPGAVLVSDPVDLVVADFADVAVDMYLPEDTEASRLTVTMHPASWQTNYVSTAGNHAGASTFPVETTTAFRRTDGLASASSFFLTRIEVLAPASTGSIVALGDSITDGTHSGIDDNNRWPDYFARRLARAGIRIGVMNAGIGGNRLLNDGTGPGALARLDRDVLAQPGVTHVILLEGINDIGQARQNPSPSAADLIAAHRQIIDRAHGRSLKIYGATLTPFEGAGYFTAEGEAKRQALNDWIRTSKAYDGFFDFDAAVRDPSRPARLQPRFDPGDHLHLNAAGYEAVAGAIDLNLFR